MTETTMSDETPHRPPEYALPASTNIWQGRMPHPLQSEGHCPCRVVRYYAWVLRRTATQLEWQAEPEYVFEASVTRDHMGGRKWEPRDFTDLPAEFFGEALEEFERLRTVDHAINDDRQRISQLLDRAAATLDRSGNREGASVLQGCSNAILTSDNSPEPPPPTPEPITTARVINNLTRAFAQGDPMWAMNVEEDLKALVIATQENQIRRDSLSLCCGPCKEKLLKDAGLR